MTITALIRTSYRPDLFKRCLESIARQSFKIDVIVSYDDDRALSYIPSEIPKVRVHKSDKPFFYDDYCNDLKAKVDSGYFFFLDDDEVLVDSECILKVSKALKNSYGAICQFSREGRLKPSSELIRQKRIIRGKVGMPCLFLHHSYKNLVHFDGSVSAADYHWIKSVAGRVPLKFVPIVVAYADRRSNGYQA